MISGCGRAAHSKGSLGDAGGVELINAYICQEHSMLATDREPSCISYLHS